MLSIAESIQQRFHIMLSGSDLLAKVKELGGKVLLGQRAQVCCQPWEIRYDVKVCA
jgi:hypothetical protein